MLTTPSLPSYPEGLSSRRVEQLRPRAAQRQSVLPGTPPDLLLSGGTQPANAQPQTLFPANFSLITLWLVIRPTTLPRASVSSPSGIASLATIRFTWGHSWAILRLVLGRAATMACVP